MNNQRGQGAVELVLLAPLFLVFSFLIFQFGWLFGSWLLVTNASREGARYAITQNCDTFAAPGPIPAGPVRDNIERRVRDTAQPLRPSDVAVLVEGGTQGVEVLARVTASYRVATLPQLTANIPFVGDIWSLPNPYIDVSGISTMRCE